MHLKRFFSVVFSKGSWMAAGLLCSLISNAQYPDQSVLFARNSVAGTARSTGAGGAFSTVGADLSSVGINPAGLGLYRSMDFSVTPGLKLSSNESVYNQSHTGTPTGKLYLAHTGIEWTKNFDKHSQDNLSFEPRPLRSITFAITYQRQSFFKRSQNFNSRNTSSSLVDDYAGYFNAVRLPVTFDNYPAEMVMLGPEGAGLILQDQVTNNYYSKFNAPVTQRGSIETNGAADKVDLAFGGNIADKLYFGFNVAVPLINYQADKSYSETPDSSAYQGYNINTQLGVTGMGFTGSLGLIYRPATWVRLGASYHLPTWYGMSENYSVSLAVDSGSYRGTLSGQYPEPLRYRLRTPMWANAGASFYYKQYGFITVDYELQHFGSSRYNFGSDYASVTSDVNAAIKSTYTYTHTVRAGLEASIKILRLRAGYSYSSSPYKKGTALSAGYKQIWQTGSIGAGIRLKQFYFDLAYVVGFTKDASAPMYTQALENNYVTHNILLTAGFKLNKEGRSKKRNRQPSNYTPPPVDTGPTDRY